MQTATKLRVISGAQSGSQSGSDGNALDREPSDETLIQSIANGDKGAMRALFERHNVAVYRFVLRLTKSSPAAEDIVSEVFLEAWRRADAFEGRSRVSTWLLAIARNKAFTTFRRDPTLPLEDELAAGIADPGDDAETILNHKNRSSLVGKCLAQLPPAQREVIDLVYYHEKSVKDVALIVGIPEGTVKTRMFHARRRTAELLKEAGMHGLWEF
jgi:RNA polymerase sigma-70 factor, ECF subfamily